MQNWKISFINLLRCSVISVYNYEIFTIPQYATVNKHERSKWEKKKKDKPCKSSIKTDTLSGS